MKRNQKESSKDEKASKQQLLESLDRSELQASRVEQYLAS